MLLLHGFVVPWPTRRNRGLKYLTECPAGAQPLFMSSHAIRPQAPHARGGSAPRWPLQAWTGDGALHKGCSCTGPGVLKAAVFAGTKVCYPSASDLAFRHGE